MITKSEYEAAVKKTSAAFKDAGIKITTMEELKIEVADFGLGDLPNTGLQLLTYINTNRVCSKEMYLSPYQTCPEHRHPGGDGYEGKEETFRCRKGRVYLYINGDRPEKLAAKMPPTEVTVFHEVVLDAGEQFTIHPDTLHWFQAGPDGAIISEFSTKSRDESDVFTDKRIVRTPEVK